MTTRALTHISRLVQADRQTAADELRQMAQNDPTEFLELIALLLDQVDEQPAEQPVEHFRFVITKQPGADNRT